MTVFRTCFVPTGRCKKLFMYSIKRPCYPYRRIFSVTGVWSSELTVEMKKEMEQYWKQRINVQETESVDKSKFYLLSMFPYPSGYLHMGHVRVYTISDAIARFQRMRGNKVIHPIGWDAFGLPAENAAIEKNIHPAHWTLKNISAMKKQLQDLNISFDWEMELSTCDPSYYKWTQYLFLLMYEKGLAYKREALVNWDPVDQTVLADEQVDENGCSWRSGCKVEKHRLEQWFLRTTAFAKNLYDGLNSPDLVEWRDATKIQQHWIGECTGYSIHFKVFLRGSELKDTLPVWTDSPELLFGVTFIAVSPDNHFNTAKYGGGQVDGGGDHLLDIEIVHPLTGSLLPVYVSDSFTYPPATNSTLGIPGNSDENSFAFAIKHELDMIPVVNKVSKTLINSEEFSRMNLNKAKEMIIEKMRNAGIQVYPTSNKLRDWLISRQRYWGAPIPIINCSSCQAVPVRAADLPVVLPHLDDFTGRGCSLKTATDWLKVKCPKCGGEATRETDTMDTFVDSSWYFLRYLDVHNTNEPFDPEKIKRCMPVDLYIGGKEHAGLHLFYARFVSHFLHSLGMLKSPEPFTQLLMQGMIHGQSFRVKKTGKYIPKTEVDFSGAHPVEKSSGAEVITEWEKMSKSKFNGIDPQSVIDEHGIDTMRLFMLGNVAPQSPRKWNDELFPGIWKWQRRIWLTVSDFITQKQRTDDQNQLTVDEIKKFENFLYASRNYYLKGATHNFLNTRQLSVSISKLQGLTGDLRKIPISMAKESLLFEENLAVLLIMLAPLAPHFASELWTGFCSVAVGSKDYDVSKSVLQQKWPVVDEDFNMQITVKVNGDDYDAVPVPKRELQNLNKATAIDLAMRSEVLQQILDNKKPKNVTCKLWPDYDVEVNVNVLASAKQIKKILAKNKKTVNKIVSENVKEINV